jgi:hypothetical protein
VLGINLLGVLLVDYRIVLVVVLLDLLGTTTKVGSIDIIVLDIVGRQLGDIFTTR